jgi:hypothetical protein
MKNNSLDRVRESLTFSRDKNFEREADDSYIVVHSASSCCDANSFMKKSALDTGFAQ